MEFRRGVFFLTHLTKCDSQFKMCGRVVWNGANGSAELGNCAIKVAQAAEAAARVGGKERGLQVGGLFGERGAEFDFGGGAGGVAELAEDGGQRGVGAGETGLETYGFAQGLGGFRQA